MLGRDARHLGESVGQRIAIRLGGHARGHVGVGQTERRRRGDRLQALVLGVVVCLLRAFVVVADLSRGRLRLGRVLVLRGLEVDALIGYVLQHLVGREGVCDLSVLVGGASHVLCHCCCFPVCVRFLFVLLGVRTGLVRNLGTAVVGVVEHVRHVGFGEGRFPSHRFTAMRHARRLGFRRVLECLRQGVDESVHLVKGEEVLYLVCEEVDLVAERSAEVLLQCRSAILRIGLHDIGVRHAFGVPVPVDVVDERRGRNGITREHLLPVRHRVRHV